MAAALTTFRCVGRNGGGRSLTQEKHQSSRRDCRRNSFRIRLSKKEWAKQYQPSTAKFAPAPKSARCSVTRASKQTNELESASAVSGNYMTKACSLMTVGALLGSSVTSLATQQAIAAEYDILSTPTPVEGNHIVDDAKVLSKASESALKKSLSSLESDTGYHIDIVTTRKLTFSADAYEFADKTIEKWYPTKELGDKKALLLLVTGSKEGAVVGGPSFIKGAGATGDSIAGESIPFYGDKELWNEAVLSSAKRLDVVLRGGNDPGPPLGDAGKAGRSYKTKEETEAKKVNFSAAVIGLLVISVVAPMLQYFAYTKADD